MAEPLPSIDFSTLILSLSQTALVHLGIAPSPEGGPEGGPDGAPSAPDLPLARQTIDMIGMLQEKTKGNLTGSEEHLIEQVLYDLRLKYVDRSKES